jgi:hypothetical protein
VIAKILESTCEGQKYICDLTVDVKDEQQETVSRVVKTLYIRRKPAERH